MTSLAASHHYGRHPASPKVWEPILGNEADPQLTLNSIESSLAKLYYFTGEYDKYNDSGVDYVTRNANRTGHHKRQKSMLQVVI
jgi:hypothetical protein